MGCPCREKAKAKAFVYTTADGTEKRYATEVEAKAAQIRAGGAGTVKAV